MAKIETPQPVRGTQSLLGEEADRFHAVIAAFDATRRLFGFKRVEVPVIRKHRRFRPHHRRDHRRRFQGNVLVRGSLGGFDHASARIDRRHCRAFLSEGWQQHAPLKVATWGAAFRYERPQKGRFRQFHQLDAEIIGRRSRRRTSRSCRSEHSCCRARD
jgi:histidyl-tRNA synthetase